MSASPDEMYLEQLDRQMNDLITARAHANRSAALCVEQGDMVHGMEYAAQAQQCMDRMDLVLDARAAAQARVQASAHEGGA